MEYVPSSDLVTFIESKGKVPEEEAKGIFRQVMDSIQFLHSNSIVHRDIKAENFLVTLPEDAVALATSSSGELAAPRVPVGPRVKLTDFGLADWITDSKSFSTPCGSPSYTGSSNILIEFSSDVDVADTMRSTRSSRPETVQRRADRRLERWHPSLRPSSGGIPLFTSQYHRFIRTNQKGTGS